MFKILSLSYLKRTAQSRSGTPVAFESPFEKKDPYKLYTLPNDGNGRKMTTMGTQGFSGQPSDVSSAMVGGTKFEGVNPNIPHPFSERGDDKSGYSDPDHPFYPDDSQPSGGTGNWQAFVSPDNPLSINQQAFDPSQSLDRNPRGPQGDLESKIVSLGRK